MTVGLWNAHSAVSEAVEINELIVDIDLDLLCLNETWLKESGDHVVIGEMTPIGYSFIHSPRTFCRGGGVAIIYHRHLKLKQRKQKTFKSFDYLDTCLAVGKQTI